MSTLEKLAQWRVILPESELQGELSALHLEKGTVVQSGKLDQTMLEKYYPERSSAEVIALVYMVVIPYVLDRILYLWKKFRHEGGTLVLLNVDPPTILTNISSLEPGQLVIINNDGSQVFDLISHQESVAQILKSLLGI